ncbi:hypothetical protein GT755_10575 [Herbidospora sp. NEAU-GS84]|uniref:Uncharacterized protein n=1 Tax=Herbidospora solisilvae TaxID=2696284 RepID=A0A7C9J1U1_9ACTN|nr:hypothetical protein [Herbidospora solisilvae]NAS22127.1 hypothetical protein [Herbidospora solisilvae]
MSYGISFLRREPGQTWHDAYEALEEKAPETVDYAVWSTVAVAVRDVLGVVSEDLLNCEVTQLSSGLMVTCYLGRWSVTLPCPPTDEITTPLREVAEIVERATGLTAYDPRLGATLSAPADFARSIAAFDAVAVQPGA